MINIFALYPKSLMLIATCLATVYFLLLHKAPKNIVIIYFWTHFFSYLGFILIYVFKDTVIHFDTTALEQFMFDTSYYNIPLYGLSAISTVASYAIFNFLLKSFSIPLILALTQMSIIITTIGYLVLGDKVTTISLIGIFIIFIGSLFSGLQSIPIKDPLSAFKNVDKKLFFWCFIKSALYSLTALITYLCISKYNETTKTILHELTKHLRFLPCMPMIPIYFNISLQLGIIIAFFVYIYVFQKSTKTVLPILFDYFYLILTLSVLYIIHTYCFYETYNFVENKNLITAIEQLYLPLTFLANYFLFKENNSNGEWIGMSLIITGTIVTIFG